MRPLKVALVGEVDAGKSTTLGQLLIKTGSVLKTKLEEVARTSREFQKDFEPAFLLDAFEFERKNEMTLDITSTYCKWWGNELHFLDTPGHRELTNKFIGGAADCDFALVIVDSSQPILPEHFRHLRALLQLGLSHYGILVNKIQVHEVEKFNSIKQSLVTQLQGLVTPQFLLPVESKSGRGFDESFCYPWWQGAPFLGALRRALETMVQSRTREAVRLMMVGQGFARLESGAMEGGATALFGPQRIEIVTAAGRHQSPKIFKVESHESCDILGDPGEVISVQGLLGQCVVLEGTVEQADEIQFKFGRYPVKVILNPLAEVQLQFEKPISLFRLHDEGFPNRDNLFVLRRDRKIIAVGVPM